MICLQFLQISSSIKYKFIYFHNRILNFMYIQYIIMNFEIILNLGKGAQKSSFQRETQ